MPAEGIPQRRRAPDDDAGPAALDGFHTADSLQPELLCNHREKYTKNQGEAFTSPGLRRWLPAAHQPFAYDSAHACGIRNSSDGESMASPAFGPEGTFHIVK